MTNRSKFAPFYVIVLLSIISLLSGCSGGRDLTSPSSRLVGHWVNGNDHYYFGTLGSDRVGTFAVKFGDRTALHRGYSLISEVRDGEQILVIVEYSDGTRQNDTYYISKDGKNMKMERGYTDFDGAVSTINDDVTYVDAATQP